MIISLDIGTTNVKAVAFSERGAVWAKAERRNQVLTPEAGRSEQDPEAIFENLCAVVTEVLTKTRDRAPVRGLVFSAAMHGLLVVDVAGKPLTDIWLWSDLRATDLAGPLRAGDAGMGLYHATGVPIHPMSPLLKIMWLRQHDPEVFARAHKFLGIKEYLLFRLLGKYLTDLPVASATGLLNIHQNQWDESALTQAGITADRLPEVVSPEHSEPLPAHTATRLGLPAGLPVVVGGSDGALANLGSGAVTPGHWAITIGTSAAIRMVTEAPFTDPLMRTFCYRLDESRCIVGGASNNGTNVLEWLRTTVFASRLRTGAFVDLASGTAAAGLLFLPYLFGERAPLWDAEARGSFRGLTAQHGRAHFVRAVMEGLLFNLKVIAEPLEALQPLEVLHAGGGFSHSRLWVQMLADIFQKPVQIDSDGIDSSVRGALLLGRKALGLQTKVGERKKSIILPDAGRAAAYAAAFAHFLAVYREK